MAVEFNHQDYGTSKHILAIPDHYVNIGQTFTNTGLVADTLGRKIIYAGTIYPANDATAKGVVFSDMDVTRGDINGSICIHGFLKTEAVEAANGEAVSAEAKAALPGIHFLDLV